MAKVGDKYILHSVNGKKYYIEVISVNAYREPARRYAVDVSNEDGVHSDDFMFVSDDLLCQCEKVNG